MPPPIEMRPIVTPRASASASAARSRRGCSTDGSSNHQAASPSHSCSRHTNITDRMTLSICALARQAIDPRTQCLRVRGVGRLGSHVWRGRRSESLGEPAIRHLRPEQAEPPRVLDPRYPGDSDSRHGIGLRHAATACSNSASGASTAPTRRRCTRGTRRCSSCSRARCASSAKARRSMSSPAACWSTTAPCHRSTSRAASALAVYVMRHRAARAEEE